MAKKAHRREPGDAGRPPRRPPRSRTAKRPPRRWGQEADRASRPAKKAPAKKATATAPAAEMTTAPRGDRQEPAAKAGGAPRRRRATASRQEAPVRTAAADDQRRRPAPASCPRDRAPTPRGRRGLTVRIATWNVNSLTGERIDRVAGWLDIAEPDVLCLRRPSSPTRRSPRSSSTPGLRRSTTARGAGTVAILSRVGLDDAVAGFADRGRRRRGRLTATRGGVRVLGVRAQRARRGPRALPTSCAGWPGCATTSWPTAAWRSRGRCAAT